MSLAQRRFALTLIGLALIALVAWHGARAIGADVLKARWSLPAITTIHLFQLFLSALAWQRVMGPEAPPPLAVFRFRWIREGINSLLPLAQIGGYLVSIRLVARRGLAVASATASTTLDTGYEAAAHICFLVVSLALLAHAHVGPQLVSWMAEGLVVVALGLTVALTAQAAGFLKWFEEWAVGVGARVPFLSLDSLRGLDREMKRLLQNRRRAAEAVGLHFLSWILGTFEVFIVLRAIGVPVELEQAFIIESLGTAARSAGFAIPAGLGVQEGGFILVCGLFGIGSEAAIALSMTKRLREIIVGVPGLLLWQRAEMK